MGGMGWREGRGNEYNNISIQETKNLIKESEC